MMKAREGDTVFIKTVILEDLGSGEYVCDCDYDQHGLPVYGEEQVVHIEHRPFKVGDKVRWGGMEIAGEIIAIHRDRAWIAVVGDRDHSTTFHDLKRLVHDE